MGSHVCLRAAMLLPLLIQRFPVLAYHFHRRQKLLNLKTGGKHDDIEFVLLSTLADNPSLVDLLDAFGYDFKIVFIERIEIVRIKDASLAS